MQHGCQRTIAKAVYLLLEKYHRLYGLKARGWAKQPGNFYISLFLDTSFQHGMTDSLPDLGDPRLTLTMYQDHVGIPAWAETTQDEMLHWQTARTHEILAWLEEQLTLSELFRRSANEMSTWQRSYSVENSEQYMLAWHVAGLLSNKLKSYILTPHYYFSDYDAEYQRKITDYCSAFSGSDPEFGILSVGGISISDRAEAYVANVGKINIWDRYCAGDSAEGVSDYLYEQMKKNEKNRANG